MNRLVPALTLFFKNRTETRTDGIVNVPVSGIIFRMHDTETYAELDERTVDVGHARFYDGTARGDGKQLWGGENVRDGVI